MEINFSGPELATLRQMMKSHGVTQIFVKELAANDNSKNQIYLGGNYDVLNLLPMGPIREETTPSGETSLKASLRFYWLRSDGGIVGAPNAQLILYPQYPEIRLSGFLKGSPGAPSDLMTQREAGRILFFGITDDRRIIAWVTSPNSNLAMELHASGLFLQNGVLKLLPINVANNSRALLLKKLQDLHHLQWVKSERLSAKEGKVDCKSSNCGGFTLEAHFGIIANSRAEPDFEGWELKGHAVKNFKNYTSGPITLMTPEPTGGFYNKHGADVFVRKYGYADKKGRPDRLNFGGVHRHGIKNPGTGLTLKFLGYDLVKYSIIDPKGGFALVDDAGNEAATWHFSSLLEHWNRKHAMAAYVPYMMRKSPAQQYFFGDTVRLAEGTDFFMFLKALAKKEIYYDPGIKLEKISERRPALKTRSQFIPAAIRIDPHEPIVSCQLI